MPLYKDAVQLIAQSGITYTPTLLVSYGGPWSENFFYERYDIHDNPKVRRFMPHDEIDQRAERRPWFRETEYVFPRIAASANAILQAGGYIGLGGHGQMDGLGDHWEEQKSTRLNSSHLGISYALFCFKKKKDQLPGITWACRSHN